MKIIIISSFILLCLDAIFIYINANIFKIQVASVQRVAMQIKPLGVILCYIFLIFGLYYFILRQHRSVLEATLFGIVVYGVFETTSYALLKKWEIKTVVLDTLWGGALMGLTTALTYQSIES
jgi:uncharacterized membrane protein